MPVHVCLLMPEGHRSRIEVRHMCQPTYQTITSKNNATTSQIRKRITRPGARSGALNSPFASSSVQSPRSISTEETASSMAACIWKSCALIARALWNDRKPQKASSLGLAWLTRVSPRNGSK